MPALSPPQKEALARELASGAANARAACIAAGYSANTAASKAHLIVRDPAVLARVRELQEMFSTLGRQDIERQLQPAQQQQQQPAPVTSIQAAPVEPEPTQAKPAQAEAAASVEPAPAQAEPTQAKPAKSKRADTGSDAATEAERKAFYADQHRRDAEMREQEHALRMRELEARERERERQQIAALPVVAQVKPGEAEPLLVRVDDGGVPDVRYTIPSTREGLGDIGHLGPDAMRAWITKHLGAVAIESRIRGDRRAAIAAADGIAKAHGLQTTKVDVTHRSALDDLSTTQMLRLQKQMQQLVELMPLIRSGEIELVTPTVEGEAIEIFSVEDAMGVAAALDQGNTTCTEIDPLG